MHTSSRYIRTSQLAGTTGSSFDQQYLANEIQSNAQSISDAQQESSSGQNAAVQQLNGVLSPFQQYLLESQILQTIESGTAPPAYTPPTISSGGLQTAPNGALNAQDQAFIQQAAQSGLTEISAGQLAETQAPDPAVGTFGNWMILDHSVLNANLQALAQAEGVTPPTTPNAEQSAMLSSLQGLSGTAFEQQYLSGEVTGHIQTIGAFAQEAANGADPALVAAAQSALPILAQHLAAAVQLEVALGQGGNDQSGAPNTVAGQTAAAIGNFTAEAVVVLVQQLASPVNNGLTSVLSTGPELYPTTTGAGTSSLASLTTPPSSSSTSAAGSLLALLNPPASSSMVPAPTGSQAG